MQNFRFICPTDFIFGKDTENSVGEEIKKYGKGSCFTMEEDISKKMACMTGSSVL